MCSAVEGESTEFLESPTREFLAATTECSAGSNDHFVVGVVVVVPSLVQFDGRPLGGTNFQY
jgi:hypothetical protein